MELREPVGSRRRCASRAGAVTLAALALCWPALVAGSPLWIPDSVVYFASGKMFAGMLLGHRGPLTLEPRSAIYSMSLYVLHHGRWPWTVIALNALLTAWVLWLVVRTAIARRPATVYLCLVAGLCLLTTVSWYVSLLTPDILGAVLFLAMYLLIFAKESMQRWEQIVCAVLVGWSAVGHPTFPMIALGLCVFLALLAVLRWTPMRGRAVLVGQIVALVLIGLMVQAVVNKRTLGRFSASGPPYLMARFIADGPAQEILKDHCDQLHWTICLWKDRLPQKSDDFLWDPNGVYQMATPAQRADLGAEEMPLALTTLRAYPRQQGWISAMNFWRELTDFGMDENVYKSDWVVTQLEIRLPSAVSPYLRSESTHSRLPRGLFHTMQEESLPVSVGILVVLLPWMWKRRQWRLLGLTAVVSFVVVTNAAITGVVSCQDPRYGGRLIWILPLLAVLARVRLGEREKVQETLSQP
jgi:hypothetical protein